MTRIVWLLVCVVFCAAHAEAANRTVCRSGCDYNNLQTAIDEAAPGDTILLRAGESFVGNFVLKAKSSSSTAFITIRSDAPASALPAAGVRLVPAGRPGANVASGALARIVGQGSTYKSISVIRTEPGAHHYRLQFLDIDGTANLGYETLVQLGENTAKQTTAAAAPHSIVLDRVYVHGHPTKGMKRGVALDTRSSEVINSYISDIMSVADAQAIGVFNGPGPFKITNNYLEASGENVLFGGSDPKIPNMVPSDIEIRGNHFFKPLAWRNAILAVPSRVTVSAGRSGSLAAGTHYFKVVAVMATGGTTVVSTPSTEVAVSVQSSGSVALSWSAVPGADGYRVYSGTSSNGQSVYVDATGTSLTYTGANQKSGTPKSSGTRWTAKNLIELKNGQRATIDGNLFENNWDGFQQGYAIVFTPRNQEGKAPWSAVRDITFTNNVVRNTAGALNILGTDDIHPSQQARNFVIRNNVFEVDKAFGGSGYFITLTSGPAAITIDHNTIISPGTVVNVAGPAVSGFVFTNNLSRHNSYGVHGQNYGIGLSTLERYFPGAVFRGNVLAGGTASNYPPGNLFPTVAQFEAAFVNFAAGDYTLKAGHSFLTAAIDGLQIGVSMPTLENALRALLDGILGPPTTPPPTTPPPTTPPPTTPPPTTPPPPSTPEPEPADDLPSGWQSDDIGMVGATGSARYAGSTFTVRGAGADIWGTADAFRYVYRTLQGDGTIVARVASLTATNAWTKAGVMIRGGTATGAPQASMFVSPGKGLAFQRRQSSGGESVSTSGGAGTAPRWVRLVRAGNVITASVSSNGQAWTVVGSDTFSMPATVLVGLPVSSHVASTLATATFDNVSVTAGAALPGGWNANDIGAVGRAGSTTFSGGTYTVKGAGADVWNTADAFHFVSTTLDGDGDIVARVASLTGNQAWTKVGVMMRSALSQSSAHAFMLVSKGKGSAFQRRTVTGAISTNTAGAAATAPRWVRLSRRGSQISAYLSSNGTSWTLVGRDTFSIGTRLEVGLAVSSHETGAVATGVFDNVKVTSVP